MPMKLEIKGLDVLKPKKSILPQIGSTVKPETRTQLNKFYKIGISDKGGNIRPEFSLMSKKDLNKRDGYQFQPQKSLQDVVWDYWLTECHDSNDSFKEIQHVFEDMDSMYWNAPVYSRSVEMYADEVVQQDEQNSIIEVFAKNPEDEKEITDLINSLYIPSFIRPTARSVVHKGNACWVLEFKEGVGCTGVIPKKTELLKDRLEFSPLDLIGQQPHLAGFFDMTNNNSRLKKLLDSMTKMDEYSSLFRKYLLGFQVGELILPAWNVLHFRNHVYDSVFEKWGMPLMINCVAPYRMYEASMSMQAIARASKFPREVYKISLPPSMRPTEVLDKMLDFISGLENSGLAEMSMAKQDFTIGSRIYSIKDLYEFELVEVKMTLDDIADIELLHNQFVLATGVPRSYYDPQSGTFGNSGIALVQQFKPFGRAVYSIQSSILEQIVMLVKLHYIFKGKSPDIEFELSMPYPHSQETDTETNLKSSLIALAKSVIDELKLNVLGSTEAVLPVDVIKRVYSMILPFDSGVIDDMIDQIGEQKKIMDASASVDGGGDDAMGGTPDGMDAGGGEDFGGETLTASLKRKRNARISSLKESEIRTLITERAIKIYEYEVRKKKGMSEGSRKGRHFVQANRFAPPFPLKEMQFKSASARNKMADIEVSTILEKLSESKKGTNLM